MSLDPIGELVRLVTSATTTGRMADLGPHAVDVHFFGVDFTEAVPSPGEFIRIISGAEHGEFGDMPISRLLHGPSYIELGGWIGDQGLALRLIALGRELEVWGVVTPGAIGVEGPEADDLAGRGFVMVGPTAKTREAFAVVSA